MTNSQIRCIVRLGKRIAILEIIRIPQCIRTILVARNDFDDADVSNVAAKLARRMRNDSVKRDLSRGQMYAS
jgi:hypothetical protein